MGGMTLIWLYLSMTLKYPAPPCAHTCSGPFSLYQPHSISPAILKIYYKSHLSQEALSYSTNPHWSSIFSHLSETVSIHPSQHIPSFLPSVILKFFYNLNFVSSNDTSWEQRTCVPFLCILHRAESYESWMKLKWESQKNFSSIWCD